MTKPVTLDDLALMMSAHPIGAPSIPEPTPEPEPDWREAFIAFITRRNLLPEQAPIELLQLPTKALNALKRAKIDRLGQIQELSDEQLLNIRLLGARDLQQVRDRAGEAVNILT